MSPVTRVWRRGNGVAAPRSIYEDYRPLIASGYPHLLQPSIRFHSSFTQARVSLDATTLRVNECNERRFPFQQLRHRHIGYSPPPPNYFIPYMFETQSTNSRLFIFFFGSAINGLFEHLLTVFFNRDIGDIFRPAMIAISELKLPILKHSRAVSIQYSTTRTRCFFFACCDTHKKKKKI